MNTVANLFYMLIKADGYIDPKELEMGRRMSDLEGFNSNEFECQVESLQKKNDNVIYQDCIEGLKKMSETDQVRFVAWMCLIANSDGFMHNAEWSLIYKIYHNELGLDRQMILDSQFKLRRQLLELTVLA